MNYQEYKLSLREFITAFLIYLSLCVLIGLLFYNTLWFLVFASPLFLLFLKYYKARLIEKRREVIKEEFKEFITSMSAALNAGYALENTFSFIENELNRSFPDRKPYLAKECERLQRKLSVKQPLGDLLLDIGRRSGIDEILEFAHIIVLAKRMGGNMINIIAQTAGQMREAMEVKKEIQIAIAAKKLEQLVMFFVPFGMVVFLRISNSGYLDCLYDTLLGRAVMTVCLIAIAIAFFISQKLLKNEEV